MKSLGLETGGPAGVKLQLKREGSTERVDEVLSADNGAFEFRAVLPGRYKISAAHKAFTFQQVYILFTVFHLGLCALGYSRIKCESDLHG